MELLLLSYGVMGVLWRVCDGSGCCSPHRGTEDDVCYVNRVMSIRCSIIAYCKGFIFICIAGAVRNGKLPETALS